MPQVKMPESDNNNLNMQHMRERLAGKRGRQYWRSLEELADTEEFQKFVEDEFPNRSTLLNVDRRTFLKYMGASMALAGLAGCRYLPEEHIFPYVKQPQEDVLGGPVPFRTGRTVI